MRLRSKGVALEIIALILGHEQVSTTYGFYLHADIGAAERAIALVAPPGTTPGRYRALILYSPSSSASDYADTIGEIAACDNEIPGQVSIIQRSA